MKGKKQHRDCEQMCDEEDEGKQLECFSNNSDFSSLLLFCPLLPSPDGWSRPHGTVQKLYTISAKSLKFI